MSSKHQDYIAALSPVLWYKFDEATGAFFANSGSTGATNDITVATDPVRSGTSKALSKHFVDMGTYSGYGVSPGNLAFGSNLTLAFWYKASSGSTTRMWMYATTNGSNEISAAAHAGFTSSGLIKFAPKIGNTTFPALQSTTNVCNGAWHHIAIVRESGTTAKIYVNGVLEHTQTWNSSTHTFNLWYPIHDTPQAFDEYVYFNTAFNATDVAALYNSTSTAYDTRIATLTAPKWWFKMEGPNDKLHNYGSFTNANGNIYVSANRSGPSAGVVSESTGGKSGGYFNFPYGNDATNGRAYFSIDPTSGSDDSAAIFNHNQNWTFEFFMKMPTVVGNNSTVFVPWKMLSSGSEYLQCYVNNANTSPAGKLIFQASGVSTTINLVSTNRVDDNAWHHVAIVHRASSGTDLYVDGTLNETLTHSSIGNGYKIFDRFSLLNIGGDSSAISSTAYLGAIDDFLIYDYALTAQQISDNNASTIVATSVTTNGQPMIANTGTFVMPVISTTRTVNYSDTASTASALAVQPTIISDDEIIYSHTVATATADALDPTITTVKQVNAAADPGTASALAVDPTVTSDDAVAYSTGPLTASALFVDPVVSTITNASISADPATASALAVQPAVAAVQNVAYTADPATADALLHMPGISIGDGHTAVHLEASALFVMPTVVVDVAVNISAAPSTASALAVQPAVAAIRNVNYSASVTTASATSVMPNVGVTEDNPGTPITASALFVMPVIFAARNRTYLADPFTSSALAVQPGSTVQTLGAIKVDAFKANAFILEPPAYYDIDNDRWYQRLQLVDYQSSTFNGLTTLFNTSADILRGGGFGGFYNAIDQRNVFQSFYGYNLNDSPLPKAFAGTFDPQNRKAIRIRNIALVSEDGFGNTGANWTFETYIKTTKANQILFVGKRRGDRSNPNYQDINAAWRLRDGKISLDNTKSLRSGWPNSLDTEAYGFRGFKNIADGEWHHIIIQNRNSDRRTQVFIDGKLDIQRYGNEAYAIHQVGYNSPEEVTYSDFETSGVSMNQGSFVLEREISLNYLACTGSIPVEATVATAAATATAGNKGRGNRARALMLYFWPTFNVNSGQYMRYFRSDFGSYGNGFTDADQGTYGSDPDTFFPLTTWIKNGANKFYDWDLWPLAVVSPYAGDVFNSDTHPILKDGVIDGASGGYRDPVTNNPRYINLMEDLKDLSQFDMICFRNYPDESGERDVFGTSAKGVTDEYFNVLDKDLFADFLQSLRDAVDTGISLFVTNPQLAVDMGFIETYEQVPSLDDVGNASFSDEWTPVKLRDPLETGSPVLDIEYPTVYTAPGRTNEYEDYYRNNYHEVVNTIPDLTDDPAFIWTDEVYYDPDGLEYGQLDRVWNHVEYNPGLQPGDKFLISSMIGSGAYYATPIAGVKAGKVITKFADTYRHGITERVNPYRDYATSIAIEPGTVVAGKQIGAKVFISFTDNLGVQKSTVSSYLPPGWGRPIESRLVELKSDYWIDYAFSTGAIDEDQRDYYKTLPGNIDRQYPNGGPVANALKYWTLNGQNVIGQANGFGDDDGDIGIDTSESVKQGKKAAKTRAGQRRRNTVSTSSQPSYTIQASWIFPTIGVSVPSINTRGLWWLSERLDYNDERPQRPLVLDADAFMPQPVVTGFKVGLVNAQAALASARIVETSLRSGDVVISSLPLTATAFLPERGQFIAAEPAVAQARITTNFRVITSADDDIVLYVMHEDPILYIREDAIK